MNYSIYKNKVIFFYLIMILGHIAHVFEEVWGRFWILNKIGLGVYLIINWILFCIPIILFNCILRDKNWAYKLSIVYVAFMGIQGLGHNIATIWTGKYFNGFAGGYSGIVLLIISIPLIYYLIKGMRINKSMKV